MKDKNYYKYAGKLHDSIIASIDILGYTEYIESAIDDNDANKKLVLLRSAIEKSHTYLEDKLADVVDFRGWEIKAYTDNITICYPIIPGVVFESFSSEGALSSMLFMLCRFQLELINTGSLFIRGAVSFEKVYSDENIVYGKGLIDAHKAESMRAIYPRIILCNNIRHLVDEHKNRVGKKVTQDILPELLKDDDGEYFIDYMKLLGHKECDLNQDEFIEKHKQLILQLMDKYGDDSNILKKYLWAAKYHNHHCQRNSIFNKLIDVISGN